MTTLERVGQHAVGWVACRDRLKALKTERAHAFMDCDRRHTGTNNAAKLRYWLRVGDWCCYDLRVAADNARHDEGGIAILRHIGELELCPGCQRAQDITAEMRHLSAKAAAHVREIRRAIRDLEGVCG